MANNQTNERENTFTKFYKAINGVLDPKERGDLKEHLARRERLYELLGLVRFAFKEARVLDIGAGSGYNTLFFLLNGAKVDIVEPNEKARALAQELFIKYKIPQEQYSISGAMLEDFQSPHKYDVICAENFLSSLATENRRAVLAQMKSFGKAGSIFVATNMCSFSYFFEDLRRLLGAVLIAKTSDFKEQSDIVEAAFAPHLAALAQNGIQTRPARDWAVDNILNPGGDNPDLCSLGELIADFCGTDSIESSEKYDILAMSPNLFYNRSWFKDLNFSYSAQILREFSEYEHILLWRNSEFSKRNASKNATLRADLKNFRAKIADFKSDFALNKLPQIAELLEQIALKNLDLGQFIIGTILETANLCKKGASGELDIKSVANAKYLAKAWGNGTQYISFICK